MVARPSRQASLGSDRLSRSITSARGPDHHLPGAGSVADGKLLVPAVEIAPVDAGEAEDFVVFFHDGHRISGRQAVLDNGAEQVVDADDTDEAAVRGTLAEGCEDDEDSRSPPGRPRRADGGAVPLPDGASQPVPAAQFLKRLRQKTCAMSIPARSR